MITRIKRTFVLVVGLLTLLWIAPKPQAAEGSMFIVGAVNDGIPIRSRVFFLRAGECLRLYPVVQTSNGYAASNGTFRDGETVHRVTCGLEGRNFLWTRIDSVLGDYSWKLKLGPRDALSLLPISYIGTVLSHEESFVLPNAQPGTYYYQFSNGGSPARFDSKVPLHLSRDSNIVQVVCRADDSYLGFLTELFNTPFILGPKMTEAGVHQTDARMGSDCAAFAIYGRRRQGYDIPYGGPRGIYTYLDELAESPLFPREAENGGLYCDTLGKVMSVGKGGLLPGDILHFGEQVSVFYRDEGVKSLLDKDDLLIQSYGKGPHVTTLEKGGFFHRAVRVFRWRG